MRSRNSQVLGEGSFGKVSCGASSHPSVVNTLTHHPSNTGLPHETHTAQGALLRQGDEDKESPQKGEGELQDGGGAHEEVRKGVLV